MRKRTINRQQRIDPKRDVVERKIREARRELETLLRANSPEILDSIKSNIEQMPVHDGIKDPLIPHHKWIYDTSRRREGLEYFCDTIIRFEQELCSYFGVNSLITDTPESELIVRGKISQDIQTAYNIFKTLLEVLMISQNTARMIDSSLSNEDHSLREAKIVARTKVYGQIYDINPSKFHNVYKKLGVNICNAQKMSIQLFTPLLKIIDEELKYFSQGISVEAGWQECYALLSRRSLQTQGDCVEERRGSLEELLPQFRKGTIHRTAQILETETNRQSFFTGDCGVYSWEDGKPVLYICGPETNLVLTGFKEHQRQYEKNFNVLLAQIYGVNAAVFYTLPDEGITTELKLNPDVLRIELDPNYKNLGDNNEFEDNIRVDGNMSGTMGLRGRKTLREVLGNAPIYALSPPSFRYRTEGGTGFSPPRVGPKKVLCVPIIITEKGEIDIRRSMFGDEGTVQRHYMRGEVIDTSFCLDY